MKLIKFFPLLVAPTFLLLSGCNHISQSSPLQTEMVSGKGSSVAQGGIKVSTQVLLVKKKPNISWKDVLPEWEPEKQAHISQGDVQALHKRMSARSDVSTEYMYTSTTSNYTPLPFSSHRSAPVSHGGTVVDTGIDLMVIPAYRYLTGPMTMMVSLSIQEEEMKFTTSQFMSLKQGESLILSFVLNENTLKVVIISPLILH